MGDQPTTYTPEGLADEFVNLIKTGQLDRFRITPGMMLAGYHKEDGKFDFVTLTLELPEPNTLQISYNISSTDSDVSKFMDEAKKKLAILLQMFDVKITFHAKLDTRKTDTKYPDPSP